MFTSKNYSFDILKERVQNAQQGLSVGWKNISDKAKKEVKIVNKIARKALATEDGGKLRDGYVVTVDLDAGFHISKGFQDNWVSIHKDSVANVNKAGQVDRHLNKFAREWQKCESYLEEFQGNLVVLPEVIAKVEIIQKRIDAIGSQTQKIEDLLLEYEDACERYELEKCKVDMRVKLSELVETKQAEFTLRRSLVNNTEECNAAIIKEMSIKKIASFPPNKQISESAEKQKAYEDAFLDQMNQYIQYGEIEKPIAGTLATQHTVPVEDINIDDSDLSTLREFLGPEEMNSLIQVQASQIKSSKTNDIERENVDVKSCLSTTSTSKETLDEGVCNVDVEEGEQITGGNATENNNPNTTLVEDICNVDVEEGERIIGGNATENNKPNKEIEDNESTAIPSDKALKKDIAEEDNKTLTVESVSSDSNDTNIDKQISYSDDENEFFDATSGNTE